MEGAHSNLYVFFTFNFDVILNLHENCTNDLKNTCILSNQTPQSLHIYIYIYKPFYLLSLNTSVAMY